MAAGASAQEADPLKSAACSDALAALQTARSAHAANVETLRGRAATACLGLANPPQRPGRVAQAPISVPPPQIEPSGRPAVPSIPGLPPPPVAISRLPEPAQCGPGGCWVDDGTHLRQVGPNLTAPGGGACIAQAGQVRCP